VLFVAKLNWLVAGRIADLWKKFMRHLKMRFSITMALDFLRMSYVGSWAQMADPKILERFPNPRRSATI